MKRLLSVIVPESLTAHVGPLLLLDLTSSMHCFTGSDTEHHNPRLSKCRPVHT